MLHIAYICLFFFTITTLPTDGSTAKILGIFPHIGKSHFFVFEPLLKELAARGHQVHVLSHFPQKTPVPNYRDISLAGISLQFEPTDSVTFEMAEKSGVMADFFELAEWGTMTCEMTFALPQVKELIQSNDTYDLVISELFVTDCFLGFVHKFRAPHVALSSCSIMPWANDRFGNPDHPAYIPNNLLKEPNLKTFYNRLVSAVTYTLFKILFPIKYQKPAQVIAEKYFGSSLPDLDAIAANTSLILVNTHPALNEPRPMVPSVIEVGGLHLQPPKALPEDLDRWLNESKHGVIYFSMGSMLRAESFPAEKRAALLQAFRELPQRVLWKWEGDSLPGKPDNVRITKWLPQWDVLNHPNVRVFMAHGGQLGVIEGAASGVPMVITPMYGDQFVNTHSALKRGSAIMLPYRDISKETVLKALNTIIYDPSYRQNAKRLSQQYLDRPQSPMDTAVFWTEYVIRHKGADHLRSAAVQLSWYQYLLLDIVLALTLGAIITAFSCCLVVRKFIHCIRGENVKIKRS